MPPPTITPETARRLTITRQHLSGPRPPATAGGILDLIRDLRAVQIDPTNAVARTQWLVLLSRIGVYDRALVDHLLWKDKSLFHYWAHAASWVLTEDFQIHRMRMREYGTGTDAWSARVREWIQANDGLRRHVLRELKLRGPLRLRDFEDRAVEGWESSGWTSGRNVSRMLEFLWSKGTVMVVGRDGNQRLWDLFDRWLPEGTPRDPMTQRQVVERAALLALRALGVATERHISHHFTSGRYPDLSTCLARLERAGLIVPVEIHGYGSKPRWYVRADDLDTLKELQSDWHPRTSLLSPFDNLIRDRERTELLFDFSFRIEIYVPKAQRRYGYFVMPVLHGDRLIARADPFMDRKSATLNLNGFHLEPGVKLVGTTTRAVAAAVNELAEFVGAAAVRCAGSIQPELARAL